MPTFVIELGGTITRDIIRREGEFANEHEARKAAAAEYPTHRVRSIRNVSCSTCYGEGSVWSGPFNDGRGLRAGKMILCPDCAVVK